VICRIKHLAIGIIIALGFIFLILNTIEEERKLGFQTRICVVRCYPHSVSYIYSNGSCVCDLTKEVKND
jgi:hypothetical protein